MGSPTLGPRRKVLFVEDESTLRRTYKRFFAERYHLAFAASGTEARRQMDEFRPEVLVLDLRLPDTDGITLLQEIRQSQPSLPVIVTTSYVSMEPLINVLDLGHSGYLVKPFDLEDLPPQSARGTDPPAAGVGAGGGGTGRDRVDRSPVPPVRTPHGTREPALLGGAVRGPRGAPRSPRRPGARASRHGRSRGSAGVVTLPGSGAARGDRQGRDPRSARPAARRAVHGARSRRGGRAPGAARRAAWWRRAGGGPRGRAGDAQRGRGSRARDRRRVPTARPLRPLCAACRAGVLRHRGGVPAGGWGHGDRWVSCSRRRGRWPVRTYCSSSARVRPSFRPSCSPHSSSRFSTSDAIRRPSPPSISPRPFSG